MTTTTTSSSSPTTSATAAGRSTSSKEDKDVGNSNTTSISIGPDLNEFRTPFDKKLYRQIMLPNGLRAVLISDVVAMAQTQNMGGLYPEEDDDDEEEEEDDDDEEMEHKNGHNHDHNDDDDDDDDDEKSNDGGSGGSSSNGCGGGGIREAAAAMVVGVGSMYDPIELQGLAHFVEHLLFMGSTKYPKENEYDSFISKHGGSDNAFTELEYTLYHFEIPKQEYLFNVLDIFAQFFTSPLMLESSVDRELNAIESEFQLVKNSDPCRIEQLMGYTSSLKNNKKKKKSNDKSQKQQQQQQQHDHPFSKFSWGNLKSLKEIPESQKVNTMEKLWNFYKQYYYASNMRLVVIGAYPLDVLQENVIKSFSDIPSLPKQQLTSINYVSTTSSSKEEIKTNEVEEDNNNNNNNNNNLEILFSWNHDDTDDNNNNNKATTKNNILYESPMKQYGMPFTNENVLEKIFYIVPVRERHNLHITWQIPCQLTNWKSKPCDYIAHLLGHEAQGSFLASLKAKSWATACSAGVGPEGYENASSHALFLVYITLSEEGVLHWMDVISELYQYVGMILYYCHNLNNNNNNNLEEQKEECSSSSNSNSSGLPTWIYDELKSIHEIAHKYEDEQSPSDLVEHLAQELAPHQCLPSNRLLDGTALLFEYDPITIKTLIDTYFTPQNARIDLVSSKFGRSSEYELKEEEETKETMIDNYSNGTLTILDPSPKTTTTTTTTTTSDGLPKLFDPKEEGILPPHKEPYFGTYYWCQQLSSTILTKWTELAKPQLPPKDTSMLNLPPVNPFVPTTLSLKELPPSDCLHPLLNCSIKLQITVGKKKQWFPATVTRYNSIKNEILLSYEDEHEKWHKMDVQPSELEPSSLTSLDFEGTLDSKKIKYRIVALAMDGEGAVRKFGDESDYDVEDGIGFPAIPPALSSTRLPKLISNTQILKLWHLQDRTFRRPIAELRLQLHCVESNKTPLHSACADLLVHLISDALTETAYLASVCELGSSISKNENGFYMRVHGFDDKLLTLFTTMLEALLTFRGRLGSDGLPDVIKEGRFNACLEVYRRICTNSGLKASKLSSDVRIRCLCPNTWSSSQKVDALKDIDEEKFVTTISTVLSKIAVEALYHGNVDVTDAKCAEKEILNLLKGSGNNNGLGLPRKKYPYQFVTKMPYTVEPMKLCLPGKDVTDPNTAIQIYVQVGKDNITDRVITDLIGEMMYEPFFDQLRTKDQIGYTVSCDSRWTNGIMGIYFFVVTSCKTTTEVINRIEQFLIDYYDELYNMSNDDFMEHLIGLTKQKLEMYNSLTDETNLLWNEIRDGKYEWDVNRLEALALRNITKEQTLKAYDEWLYPKNSHGNDNNNEGKNNNNGKNNSTNKKRRMMIVEVISNDGVASDGRPNINSNDIETYIDKCVNDFHKSCKNQTWGRIF